MGGCAVRLYPESRLVDRIWLRYNGLRAEVLGKVTRLLTKRLDCSGLHSDSVSGCDHAAVPAIE